eukprot:TRINITY_DN9648_c0_g1_i1.p1 TRINITY_DN9648_c0_g1~~TRINITY_DN9648_c0_g1_i1.p1  ORF type:complete len:330 (-),score=62.72 TRINITY_DN9648_c0_g1_i1:7-996(-)
MKSKQEIEQYIEQHDFDDDDDIDFGDYDFKKLSMGAMFFSFLSDVTLYPIDLVATRMMCQGSSISSYKYTSTFQAFRNILTTEGLWKGLYRGFWVSATMNPFNQAAYYGSYEIMAMFIEGNYEKAEKKHAWLPRYSIVEPLCQFVMGGCAELISGLIWVPMDVISSRLQIQGNNSKSPFSYANGREATRLIFRREGIQGFYRAYGSAMLVDVPSSAVAWVTYEQFKYAILKYCATHDINFGIFSEYQSHMIATVAGFAAGALAAIATNPIQVATVRMQVQPRIDNIKYKNGVQTMKLIVAEEGATALSSGLLPRIMKQAPVSCFGRKLS